MVWYPGKELHNGKYKVISEIGSGSFAITYRVQHELLSNRAYIIKSPNLRWRKDKNYKRYVERFIQEAKQLDILDHPHIVEIIDLFKERDGEDNVPCLVMKLISGQDLFDLVESSRGGLPESKAVNYISQIGDALAFMHEKKLVHRDAHPGNIMVQDRGQAILIDFGLAREIVPKSPTSVPSANESFAPWEQKKGNAQPTVDIYCLAASLYYAVTGEYPAPSRERKYEGTQLDEPKQHKSEISNRLNEAIMAGMALDPQDRPQLMREWLKMLLPPNPISPESLPNTKHSDAISPTLTPDYTQLEALLAKRKWKQADEETLRIMKQKVGRLEPEDWLTEEDFESFSCDVLHEIDKLWAKHSNHHFGFSAQKEIWLSGEIEHNDFFKFMKFMTRLGWGYQEEERPRTFVFWGINLVAFDLSAPKGLLPLAVTYYGGNVQTRRKYLSMILSCFHE